jgi:hypothetical protein
VVDNDGHRVAGENYGNPEHHALRLLPNNSIYGDLKG